MKTRIILQEFFFFEINSGSLCWNLGVLTPRKTVATAPTPTFGIHFFEFKKSHGESAVVKGLADERCLGVSREIEIMARQIHFQRTDGGSGKRVTMKKTLFVGIFFSFTSKRPQKKQSRQQNDFPGSNTNLHLRRGPSE
jgi:hypothetical protein